MSINQKTAVFTIIIFKNQVMIEGRQFSLKKRKKQIHIDISDFLNMLLRFFGSNHFGG